MLRWKRSESVLKWCAESVMELSATTNCCVKGMVSFVCSFVYLFAGSGMIFIPVGIRTIDTKVL